MMSRSVFRHFPFSMNINGRNKLACLTRIEPDEKDIDERDKTFSMSLTDIKRMFGAAEDDRDTSKLQSQSSNLQWVDLFGFLALVVYFKLLKCQIVLFESLSVNRSAAFSSFR